MSITPFSDGIVTQLPNLMASSPDWEPLIRAYGSMFDLAYYLVADQGSVGGADYVPGWSNLLDPDNCPTQFLPYLGQFNGSIIPAGTPDFQARQIIKLENGMQRGTVAAIQAAALRYLVGTSTQLGTLQELADTNIMLSTDRAITSFPVNKLTQTVAPQTITVIDPTNTYQQQFQVMAAAYPGATSLDVYPATPIYPFPPLSTVWGPFLFIRERYNGTADVDDAYHLTVGYRPSESPDITALKTAVNAVKPAGIIIDFVESDAFTWDEATGTWTIDTMSWAQTATQQP